MVTASNANRCCWGAGGPGVRERQLQGASLQLQDVGRRATATLSSARPSRRKAGVTSQSAPRGGPRKGNAPQTRTPKVENKKKRQRSLLAWCHSCWSKRTAAPLFLPWCHRFFFLVSTFRCGRGVDASDFGKVLAFACFWNFGSMRVVRLVVPTSSTRAEPRAFAGHGKEGKWSLCKPKIRKSDSVLDSCWKEAPLSYTRFQTSSTYDACATSLRVLARLSLQAGNCLSYALRLRLVLGMRSLPAPAVLGVLAVLGEEDSTAERHSTHRACA